MKSVVKCFFAFFAIFFVNVVPIEFVACFFLCYSLAKLVNVGITTFVAFLVLFVVLVPDCTINIPSYA